MSFVPIYGEESVPPYTLPELLISEAGQAIDRAELWQTVRRPELLRLFREHVYGTPPDADPHFRVEIRESGLAFNLTALREQIRLRFGNSPGAPFIDLLLYHPRSATPAPLFLGLNFKGNHATTFDPAVFTPSSWVAEAAPHGAQQRRWPFEQLLAAGFAVATFYYGDAAPDHPQRWREGLVRLSKHTESSSVGSEPGAIAWWAWALSRACDYLSTHPAIDAKRISVVGHSRQGKAALLAGAEDERFALVISNNSGCTGAALSRRRIGERLIAINERFPYWFCRNYHQYNEREHELPIDQHQLIALTAPRPVYIASATNDLWADPVGEFLAAVAAAPVYNLFGYTGVAEALGTRQPPPDTSVGDRIGYHLRTGDHDILTSDWQHFVRFAKRQLCIP